MAKRTIVRTIQNALTLSPRDFIMLLLGAVLAVIIGGLVMFTQNHQTVIPYQTAGITAPWIPPTVRHWDKQINEMAKKYDIDANLIAIIMTMESGGNPKARSAADARGLMQVTPLTAGDISQKFLKEPRNTYDLYDPATSIEFGTAYLAWLRDEFGTIQQGPDYTRTVELVAAGYNGGAGTANALEQGEGLRDTEPVIYSRDAFNMWRERVSKTSPTFDRWKERGGSSLLEAAAKSQQ
jgi:hypothetical protein